MAAHKRKQPAPASKLPMPNFDSDSEDDELDQDRRAKPSGSKGKARAVPVRSQYDDDDDDEEEEEEGESEDEAYGAGLAGDEEGEGQGAGVAVWEEDEMEGMEEEYTDVESGEDESDEEDDDLSDEGRRPPSKQAGSSKAQMAQLQKDLEQVPLSLLRRAQSKLQKKNTNNDDSDADSDASGGTTASMSGLSDSAKAKRLNDIKRRLAAMQRVKGKALNVTVSDAEESGSDDGLDSRRDNGWAIRRERREEREEEKDRVKRREEEKERLKRFDKHAPMVMSAKRMVTRKRNAIEPEKIERRDPRFSSMSAGNTDTNLTATSYSFVPKLIEEEYQNLRSALQLAVKRERTSPRHEREDRVAEREQLEREVNRARTRLDVARKAEREREVMKKVKQEQKERAKDGKGTFHLKRGEKKDLLLKARFEALQAEGGKRAIKKAIEKKQKKVAGKEKKSRPFAKGAFGGGGGGVGGGGDAGGGADGGPRKRRKVG